MDVNEYRNIYLNENQHWWYKGLHELVELFIQKIKNNKDIKIFDAGCGTGKMLSILSKYGNVSGVDSSKLAINFSKQRGIKNVEVKDLNKWIPNEEVYDVLISLDVLYHSQIHDDLNIINKFYKTLKIEGVLILNLPALDILKRSHDITVGGKRRYSKKKLKSELKKIGFQKIRYTYRLPHLFFLIIIKKTFQKICFNKDAGSDLKPIHPIINRILFQLNRIENFFILKGFVFPIGSSVFMVAKK